MKNYTKIITNILLKSKKTLIIVYIFVLFIAAYYSIITVIYMLFLLPLIFIRVMGAEEVEFFNVLNSNEINRTDISYFTTGDIIYGIEILFSDSCNDFR